MFIAYLGYSKSGFFIFLFLVFCKKNFNKLSKNYKTLDKLMVAMSSLFSMSIFGFNMSMNLITADWKIDKNLPFETASIHGTFQESFFNY